MPDRMPEGMPGRMPDEMSDRMPEDMPDRMPEDLPEDMPDRMPKDLPEDVPEHMLEDMPEDMPDRMPEDLPVRKCINVMVGITRSKVLVSICILWYLYIDRYSSKVLFVSLCISMYLNVSFETGSQDIKRYKKIHVTFCIFCSRFNRYIKIHLGTFIYVEVHKNTFKHFRVHKDAKHATIFSKVQTH